MIYHIHEKDKAYFYKMFRRILLDRERLYKKSKKEVLELLTTLKPGKGLTHLSLAQRGVFMTWLVKLKNVAQVRQNGDVLERVERVIEELRKR